MSVASIFIRKLNNIAVVILFFLHLFLVLPLFTLWAVHFQPDALGARFEQQRNPENERDEQVFRQSLDKVLFNDGLIGEFFPELKVVDLSPAKKRALFSKVETLDIAFTEQVGPVSLVTGYVNIATADTKRWGFIKMQLDTNVRGNRYVQKAVVQQVYKQPLAKMLHLPLDTDKRKGWLALAVGSLLFALFTAWCIFKRPGYVGSLWLGVMICTCGLSVVSFDMTSQQVWFGSTTTDILFSKVSAYTPYVLHVHVITLVALLYWVVRLLSNIQLKEIFSISNQA